MIWFTADHHFGHADVIAWHRRPFDDTRSMDRAMIDDWNRVVDRNDLVYHLGDVTTLGGGPAKAYFAMLNGRIKVLSYPWHRDGKWIADAKNIPNITLVSPLVVLNFDGHASITLCHYPMETWHHKFYGSWMLHGHDHGESEPMRDVHPIMDVGVDNAYKVTGAYRPFSFKEIAPMMHQRQGINVYKRAKA